MIELFKERRFSKLPQDSEAVVSLHRVYRVSSHHTFQFEVFDNTVMVDGIHYSDFVLISEAYGHC